MDALSSAFSSSVASCLNVTITSPGIALASGGFLIGSIAVAGSKSAVGGFPLFGSITNPSAGGLVAKLASVTPLVFWDVFDSEFPTRLTGEERSEQAKAIAVSDKRLRFKANDLLINPPA